MISYIKMTSSSFVFSNSPSIFSMAQSETAGEQKSQKHKNPFDISEISMSVAEITSKRANISSPEASVIIGQNYYIYKSKVLFIARVREEPNSHLVCLNGNQIPHYIHAMINDEEIELEVPRHEFFYLNNHKTVPGNKVSKPDFIETYGETFYEIKQITSDDGWTIKVTAFTAVEGIKKIIIVVMDEIRSIEFYDCGFVRVKISEGEEYLIRDYFNGSEPFLEAFPVITDIL